jgi:hypothetical protein
MTGAASRTSPERVEETISAGTHRIGSLVGDRQNGFRAFDENGALIELFETRDAARRAIYEAHKQGGPR